MTFNASMRDSHEFKDTPKPPNRAQPFVAQTALVAHSSIAPHRQCNGPQDSASITAWPACKKNADPRLQCYLRCWSMFFTYYCRDTSCSLSTIFD